MQHEVVSGPDFPLLTTLVLLPAIGALLVALVPRRRVGAARLLGLLVSAAVGALSVWTMVSFNRADDGFQFVSKHSWISDLGISWNLGLDGISLFLVVLTGLLFPLAIIGVKPKHDPYIQSSRMCGSCHTIDLPVVDSSDPVQPVGPSTPHSIEQATYLEWLNSAYQNEFGTPGPQAQSCQDCHMPVVADDTQGDHAPSGRLRGDAPAPVYGLTISTSLAARTSGCPSSDSASSMR